MRRPPVTREERQREEQDLTEHACQRCGARISLADLVSGRAIHEEKRLDGAMRTRCRECAREGRG